MTDLKQFLYSKKRKKNYVILELPNNFNFLCYFSQKFPLQILIQRELNYKQSNMKIKFTEPVTQNHKIS